MKTRLQLFLSLALTASPLNFLFAEKPEPAVPVIVNNYATPSQNGPENQKLYGPSNATIVPPEQAKALVDKFREAYPKMGSPRILFYINRELIDTSSGIKLTGRTEKYDDTKTTSGQTPQSQTTHTSGENTYVLKDGTKATLADRQTVREVERLFGRAFRAGGASLADQKVAADLIGDKPVSDLAGTTDQAAKDREALSKVADVVVEILVASRVVAVAKVSGDEQVTVPDIQATAIRLKDAAIVGQAASTDVLGKDQNAGQTMMQFDVRDVTEATALALMEDMSADAK